MRIFPIEAIIDAISPMHLPGLKAYALHPDGPLPYLTGVPREVLRADATLDAAATGEVRGYLREAFPALAREIDAFAEQLRAERREREMGHARFHRGSSATVLAFTAGLALRPAEKQETAAFVEAMARRFGRALPLQAEAVSLNDIARACVESGKDRGRSPANPSRRKPALS